MKKVNEKYYLERFKQCLQWVVIVFQFARPDLDIRSAK